jgi:hypothetical protein
LIRFKSAVRDTQTTTIDHDVQIIADPGATLDRDGDGPILQVEGTSTVVVSDLKISGATNLAIDSAAIGVSNGAALHLTRVTVTENAGSAIVSEGVIVIEDSNISGNAGVAVRASAASAHLTIQRSKLSGNHFAVAMVGGSLEMSRCTILANSRGGISMSGAGVVSITNTFMVRNGYPSPGSFAGAASLVPQGASKFEFNTLVDNLGVDVGAVSCNGNFSFGNNLIVRNTSMTGEYGQTWGTCSFGNSLVATDTAVGNAFGFVSPNVQPYDYHLTASSPANVVDAAGTCSGVDFDGDARPAGDSCDLGADERLP